MTQRQAVTLADVARHAHVSLSTASMVLRGAKGPSEITRQQVTDAARELGYQANVGARNLRKGVPQAVGILLDPSIAYPHPYSPDLFYSRYLDQIVVDMSRAGIPVTVLSTTAPSDTPALPVGLAFDVAQGEVVRPDRCLAFGTTRLYLGHPLDDPEASAYVRHDYFAIARAAFDYLWERGSRRPALAYSPIRRYAHYVLEEYRRWCEVRGIQPTVIRSDSDDTRDGTIDELAATFRDGTDGVFVLFGDVFLVTQGIRRAGVTIGRDLHVLVEGEGIIEGQLDRPIPALSLMASESGKITSELIVELLADPRPCERLLPFKIFHADA